MSGITRTSSHISTYHNRTFVNIPICTFTTAHRPAIISHSDTLSPPPPPPTMPLFRITPSLPATTSPFTIVRPSPPVTIIPPPLTSTRPMAITNPLNISKTPHNYQNSLKRYNIRNKRAPSTATTSHSPKTFPIQQFRQHQSQEDIQHHHLTRATTFTALYFTQTHHISSPITRIWSVPQKEQTWA
ncbi:hypothetical protein WMY93_027774 [Mugilogobius chulae]|uniref:Uncharacterized protein n=1 Tax=Mugilogobius chulae TaxID=88201 RepID=A0AAW0MXC1_9GOBI